MITENVPPEINNLLADESADFIVKSKRITPLNKSLSSLVFGLIWLAFTSIIFIFFLGPIFVGQEVRFEANGVPTVAGPGNLAPLVVPALIIGIFILIGLVIIGFSIYSFIAKGAWYIGTPSGLIIYQKNKTRRLDWEQFSGDIEVRGNPENGSIMLGLRTGEMVNSKYGSAKYTPYTVYIIGINNTTKIAALLQKRIKENDPTPSAASS